MKTPFSQLNLSSVEHLWVEYHVAESCETLSLSGLKMSPQNWMLFVNLFINESSLWMVFCCFYKIYVFAVAINNFFIILYVLVSAKNNFITESYDKTF
jgi:hypothetical protein